MPTTPWSLDKVEVASLPFSFHVQHYSETSSTSELMQEQADKGASEGLVFVSDYQTEGRGKPGRQWLSPRGENLLFSILLRPKIQANRAPILTQVLCRSVAAVLLRDYGIESEFKRPNDILVKKKKICGVLVESVTSNSKLESAVVGIGLNVNSPASALLPEAISMFEAKKETFDRETLLRQILQQIGADLKGFYASAA